MESYSDCSAMQRQARGWQAHLVPVAFVPTMGSLHEGHLSLVARACREIGREGKIVVSIYVNPTQFAPHETWPPTRAISSATRNSAPKRGWMFCFAPPDREMYPADFSTYVTEERLSQGMEGPRARRISAALRLSWLNYSTSSSRAWPFSAPRIFNRRRWCKNGPGFEFSAENHHRSDCAGTRRIGLEFAQQILDAVPTPAGADPAARPGVGQGGGSRGVCASRDLAGTIAGLDRHPKREPAGLHRIL